MHTCHQCHMQTPADGRFCQHCGALLSAATSVSESPRTTSFLKSLLSSAKKLPPQGLLAVLVLLGIGFYNVPQVKGYLAAGKYLAQAEALEKEAKYKDALAKLGEAEKVWVPHGKKEQINVARERNKKFAEYQDRFASAKEKASQGKFDEARADMHSIPVEYPGSADIEQELISLQAKIEEDLKRQVADKEAEAKAAEEKRKAEASEAKRQAQKKEAALARVEADKAAAQAQAQAAAAQKAQAEAQVAEARKAAEQAREEAGRITTADTQWYINNWNRAQDYLGSGHRSIERAIAALSLEDFSTALGRIKDALLDYNAARNALGSNYIPEMATSHRYLHLAIGSYLKAQQALFNAVYYLDSEYLELWEQYVEEGDRYIQLANDYIGKY